MLVFRPSFAFGAEADPHRVAFLSDSHIGEKAETNDRDCNMADRLKQVAAEVAKFTPRVACAVVNGDLAHKTGTAMEYKLFASLIDPVREAGIPLHLGLGNHDNFTRFAEGLDKLRPKDKPVEGKQVTVVELERANLFVLDSYDPMNAGGGMLGDSQLKWLAKALDDRKTKPAVVFAHHPLQFNAPKNVKSSGIADTNDFWSVLKDRLQVKAFVFGQTHTWKLAERDGGCKQRIELRMRAELDRRFETLATGECGAVRGRHLADLTRNELQPAAVERTAERHRNGSGAIPAQLDDGRFVRSDVERGGEPFRRSAGVKDEIAVDWSNRRRRELQPQRSR